jgi:hypothetical protein
VLGDGGENVNRQLARMRVIDRDKFNARFHEGCDESQIAGKTIKLGNNQLGFVTAADNGRIVFLFRPPKIGFSLGNSLGLRGSKDAALCTCITGVSEVPLPATLPLFATGLGALGLLGWRRKRKNAAVIAA